MKDMNLGYFFITMASIVIVLAGIKSASEIIVPFLLSLFLAIILSPLYNFFNRYKIPNGISLTMVISLFVILIFLVAKLIGSSLHEFNANIDNYTQQLNVYYNLIINVALKFGIEISYTELSTLLDSKQVMLFASGLMKSIGSVFTNGFVILLTVIFMMLESENIVKKIKYINANKPISHIETILAHIKEYMVLKAVISFFTGFIVWLSLSIVGTDFPFLWAVLAFSLNFIPNIGSIIAAVPAVLLTLIQFGSLKAVIVAIIYLLLNIIIGSVIEPKVMGKGLGLSTLVVFLSLIFWGWLLGMVGMLLSIPLTIMVKIILDENEKTKWLAVMLGTGDNLKLKI